jgi:CO/xanthine dehydrogenase Mo-binding subunit
MVPEIETLLVEVPSEMGAYGAKGVGEPPAIPGPAAVANAIRDATGGRVTSLPMRPEVVLAVSQAPVASAAD